MFIRFLLKSLISSENFTKGKQTCCLYFDLRPSAKQNEHKASKILKKISDFMTEGRREEKKCTTGCGRMAKRTKTPK